MSKESTQILWNLVVIILALAILLLCYSRYSHPQPSTQPIIFKTLANNLDVIIKQTPGNLVAIQVWIRTGTLYENPETNGLAHLLEHMLFKKKRVVENIESLGGYFNAATSYDFVYYYITVTREHALEATKLLSEIVFDNNFTEEEFAKEKKVVLEEISRSQDSPEQEMYDFVSAKIYGTHPYSQKILGDPEKIKQYSLTDLTSFYKTYYQPNNATICIAGNFHSKQLNQLISILKEYSPHDTPASLQRNAPASSGGIYTARIPRLSTPHLYLVYLVPGVNSFDSYALDLLTYLLGNRTNSVLNRALKEQQGLTYTISASYQTRKKQSVFIVDIPLKNSTNSTLLRNQYDQLLANLTTSNQELALMKTILVKDYQLNQENVNNIAYGLGYYNTLDSYTYETNYLKNIRRVTPEDISALLRKYFQKKSATAFLFLPESY